MNRDIPRIRILFVDDEESIREQAKIFLEKAEKEFQVDTVATAKEAVKNIKKKKYDVIVADYLLPDVNGLQLLKALRSRGFDIPFIVLTGKGKEEVAMGALNLGANKYFKKNNNPKEQYDHLASAIIELLANRKDHLKGLPFDVKRLLSKMVNREIEILKPTIDLSDGIDLRYVKAEEILDVENDESEEILESLYEDNLLKRDFYDKILICPECSSTKLKFSTLCPRCSSPHLSKEKVIEHLDCGYWGAEDEFKNDSGDYVCPKCKDKLKAIGVDYSKRANIFICGNCGERIDNPEESWECKSCSKEFSTEEGENKIIYQYELNKNKRGWLKLQLRNLHKDFI